MKFKRTTNLKCKTLVKAVAFLRNTSASTALMFSLSLPAVLGAVGVAADFGIYQLKHGKLQVAADQAALAGAKELTLTSSNDSTIQAAANSFAQVAVGDSRSKLDVKATTDFTAKTVNVQITEVWTPFFAHFIGAKITPIVVNAKAGLFGESKICVLTLTPNEFGAVSMTKKSHLQAEGCTVYSNSNSASSIYMGDVSSIDAKLVCTVGGVKDNGSLTGKKVVTDCPVLSDPLASRPRLSAKNCDFTNAEFKSGTTTISPGVYCGGIKVSGNATVNLNEGEYIIKDGPLIVYGSAAFRGKNVGFFLTGKLGLMQFLNDATIDLSGRETGAMAGMLVFDDPLEKGILRIHSISANHAINLTGTIYLPNGNLIVDPAATVGEKSAYTAIVAKRLIVENGPTLVLNTNYNMTPVPVPEGIRAAADIQLIE
jgi:Flp pilus assembly protein TadG